jgi:hypothetical protein
MLGLELGLGLEDSEGVGTGSTTVIKVLAREAIAL